MKKLLFVALDDTASQAIDMASLSPRSDRAEMSGGGPKLEIEPGKLPIFVATAATPSLLEALGGYKGRGFLVFPEPPQDAKLPQKLLESGIVLVPVRVESLATLAFSQTLKSLEYLFDEYSPEDFNLGSEDYFGEVRPGLFHRLFHAEGRHLKEAVLRMAHRVRSQRTKEGVAYILRLPANTALFALDEAIDVLEIAVPPEKPIYFAIRFDKSKDTPVRISALVATPEAATTDLQSRIDAQPTYLGKLSVVIEAFAYRDIDEKEMEKLCRENGLEPDDADRLYDLVYARSDETADLIRRLGSAMGQGEREALIAEKLAEGFIDVRVLEELANLFGLRADTILKRADEIKKKTAV
ncbi:hypothetical protein [Hydrogenimonas sp.]